MLSTVFKRCFSTSSTLLTWGETNYGWGRQVTDQHNTPKQVEGFHNVIQVASGPYHLAFLTETNDVFTVGYGKNGRLGNGKDSTTELPEKINVSSQGKSNIVQLACGDRHTLALDNEGSVYSWGYHGRMAFYGCSWFTRASPLGHGPASTSDINNRVPNRVQHISNVSQIAAGADFSIALDQQGKLWGWGELNNTQLPSLELPGQLVDINAYVESKHTAIKKIKAIGGFTMALLENGKLYAIGRNDGGVTATRANPKIITDNVLQSFTKINDAPLQGEKIVDFEVSGNSLILRTDADRIFYSGMHAKFLPTLFPSTVKAESIWATYDSVGIIGQDGKIYFINDIVIEDHDKVGELMISDDPTMKGVWKIGGSYRLRFALRK